MATVDLGKIRFNWTGAYNNSTAYVVNDVVSSGGNSYICILASTGNAVSNATYWSLMAQAGTNGTDVGTVITTQGDILYRDGSGLQRLAKGTASQSLTMNSGATAPEWTTPAGGGGAWNLIGTTTASNSSTIGVTGIDATYDRYVIDFTDIRPSSNAVDFYMRFGTSGGILTAGGYGFRATWASGASGTGVDTCEAGGNDGLTTSNWRGYIAITPSGTFGVGDTAPEGVSGTMNLYMPHTQNTVPNWNWTAQLRNDTGNRHYYIRGHGTRADSSEDITQVQALFESGNIASGRMTVWGIAHA